MPRNQDVTTADLNVTRSIRNALKQTVITTQGDRRTIEVHVQTVHLNYYTGA